MIYPIAYACNFNLNDDRPLPSYLNLSVQFRLDHALEAKDLSLNGIAIGAVAGELFLNVTHTSANLVFQASIGNLDGMVRLAFIHQGTNLLNSVLAVAPTEILEHGFQVLHLSQSLSAERATGHGHGKGGAAGDKREHHGEC